MASQVNPVIAAFLQAQQLGQQDAENIMRQKQFQENLAFQREAQEAEQQLQQSQLQQRILKEQNRAKESETRLKQDLIGRRTGFFRLMSDAAKGGSFDPEAFRSLGASVYGLDPNDLEDMIQKGRSYAEILKEQTNAKKEQTENYFGLRTKSAIDTAKGILPSQKELVEFKSKLAQDEYKAKADADYKKAVDVAKIRAQSVIDGITKRAAVGGAKSAKKLTDSTKQKFVDLEVAEGLYNEIGEFLKDPKKKKYFAGPIGAKLRGLKKATQGLDATEAEVEAGLGRGVAIIGHPLFGAALTPQEKQVLLSFVPGESGDITPEAALAKVQSGLKYVKSLRETMLKAHGLNSETSTTPKSSSNVDAIKAKYGLK